METGWGGVRVPESNINKAVLSRGDGVAENSIEPHQAEERGGLLVVVALPRRAGCQRHIPPRAGRGLLGVLTKQRSAHSHPLSE